MKTNLTEQPLKVINLTLWVLQFMLALMFFMAGSNKLFQTISELSKLLPWVTQVSESLVKFIGLSELLGSIGLLVPSITKIKPIFSVYAAFGLAIVQLLAVIFHISRGELSLISMNLVLIAVALFIAWGRLKKAPINAR